VSEALGETPTWVKVRRANAALDGAEARLRGPEVAVNLLASFNLEPIEPALRLGLQCIPCRPQLRIAPLNTIEQTLLDKGSPVYQESSLATVVLWRIEELLPEVLLPFSSGGAEVLKRQVNFCGRELNGCAAPIGKRGIAPVCVDVSGASCVIRTGTELPVDYGANERGRGTQS